MNDDIHPNEDALQISPDREKGIWEHFIGLYIDRFIKKDNTIDIEGLKECLQTKLGPLFVQHVDKFESLLQNFNGTVDRTRTELSALLSEPFQQLRKDTYPDYPTFELKLRVLNQEQNGFTPLTSNRMVLIKLMGNMSMFTFNRRTQLQIKEERWKQPCVPLEKNYRKPT
jgi:hypothetical protein